MGISVLTLLPDGRRAEIDSDVLGVARRLAEGDPTLGWPGDPALGLVWDDDAKRFEVWHTSVTGEAYLVASHARCDAELIRKVVMADQHHTDVLARIRRDNERLEAERQRQADDWFTNEWAPKAQWAIKQDFAQHLGGKL